MTLKSLTHWNYRVVKTTHVHPDGETETEYGIHECFYNPLGWTEEPVEVATESVDGLRDVLNRMLLALELDVIEGEPR